MSWTMVWPAGQELVNACVGCENIGLVKSPDPHACPWFLLHAFCLVEEFYTMAKSVGAASCNLRAHHCA